MPSYALDLEFDGRAFHGTALQPERRTLTQILRAALAELCDEPVLTRTCGRLDAGVDASSLVVSCQPTREWQPAALGRAINTRLPDDVVCHRVGLVPDGWDALAAATSKTYRYDVRHSGSRTVLDAPAWWVRGRFDGTELVPLAAALVGAHDLSAFSCLRGDGTDANDAVRRYTRATWDRLDDHHGERWRFTITGSGFLYKQVRGLVGAMVTVAQGRETAARFLAGIGRGRKPQELATDRIGRIAPGRGLRLMAAAFDPEPVWYGLSD